MNPGSRVLFAVVLASIAGQVTAQEKKHATLSISVQKRTLNDDAPKPFQGVGTFDITRGSVKVEGATCPDHSGPGGQVRCTIPCKVADNDSMVFRVKAPSDQDVLVGYIAPVSVDVEVRKCAVKPATVTMLYEDAKHALDRLLKRKFTTADTAGGWGGGNFTYSGGSWIDEIRRNPAAVKAASGSAASPEGRADLIAIHRYATLAAANVELQMPDQSAQTKALVDALAEWQVLTKSTLLEARMSQIYPKGSWGTMKLGATTDLTSYRAYLANADEFVGKAPNKSGDLLRLGDDIKTLKSTPSTGKDAAAATTILEGWK
jgi:hypothetical protein